MEIILLEKIQNLGHLGDVVSVKDGYARNFLIPSGKAQRATKENKAVFEERKQNASFIDRDNYLLLDLLAKSLGL